MRDPQVTPARSRFNVQSTRQKYETRNDRSATRSFYTGFTAVICQAVPIWYFLSAAKCFLSTVAFGTGTRVVG